MLNFWLGLADANDEETATRAEPRLDWLHDARSCQAQHSGGLLDRFEGRIYDITEYAQIAHPGGKKIYLGKGKDCTELFN
jgi:hypothetical protein